MTKAVAKDDFRGECSRAILKSPIEKRDISFQHINMFAYKKFLTGQLIFFVNVGFNITVLA